MLRRRGTFAAKREMRHDHLLFRDIRGIARALARPAFADGAELHSGLMLIRDARVDDWPRLWPIIRAIIKAGDTYTLPPDMSETEARSYWMRNDPWQVFVAESEGVLLGTGKIGPNQGGPGAHIANGSYMVTDAARGRGVGRALVTESLRRAQEAGFHGMQFNAVAASNRGAVRLYEELGFRVIGTVPGGFAHPRAGYVGLHIMYCPL